MHILISSIESVCIFNVLSVMDGLALFMMLEYHVAYLCCGLGFGKTILSVRKVLKFYFTSFGGDLVWFG